MARKKNGSDPVVEKLDAILTVMQNLLIVEGAKIGMTRDELRPMVGVATTHVSKVMTHVKRARKAIGD